MRIDLTGRMAMVCGSTQGIGRACAEGLATSGADVVLVARNATALSDVRDALPANGGQRHDFIEADFASWTTVRDRVTEWITANGPVHILVNNSGGPPAGPASDADPTSYESAFAQHLLCNQVLVQAVLEGMRSERYGRIINIISTSVLMPIKGLGVSNTIRGAVGNWARTIASEVASSGITVNNILPGFTATQRLETLFDGRAERTGTTRAAIESDVKTTIPAGRFATPDEIANVAVFLSSMEAAYVNGVNLPVDGGRLAAQ